MKRRKFLKTSAATAALLPNLGLSQSGTKASADSLVHGPEWESLNPGYWQVKDGALRRRMKNYGDRARRTGFPYHSETHGKKPMQTEYDPSLPHGILWRRDWRLKGNYKVTIKGTYHADTTGPEDGDKPEWKMYQPGYGVIGIAIGGQNLFEGYGREKRASIIGWQDDAKLAVVKEPKPGKGKKAPARQQTPAQTLKRGDTFTMTLEVSGNEDGRATVTTTLDAAGKKTVLSQEKAPRHRTDGFVGLAARGLIDFDVNSFEVEPGANQALTVGHAQCSCCYPLGDSLKKIDGSWQVKFVGVFASDGKKAEIRVTDTETPEGGWGKVPVSGSAEIIDNDFRRNTAVVTVTLPKSPGDTTLYYTVWKDGTNVTTDPRIGTDACGPGTGLVGDVPASGSYVGRLPQLKAPYKLCGLSCHAITSGLQQRTEDGGFKVLGGGDVWQVRDQPTVEAYKHLDDYNFQIMVWEDDVWYMELVLYPPSTDDAYKVVANSIFGPTSRWQMMRHWNVINPGDHDYGMDDVKGPEQIAIRKHEGLGQDPSYMRRNFQIVHHLVTGAEEVDPLANPKKWRAWKMPHRDFTFVITDARLWRSSQETEMWKDWGWDKIDSPYDRADPTRALLGEEQYAWLQQVIRTDAASIICLTGMNALHTIWSGNKAGAVFAQRDRVAADYAGWVKAGADRVIELLAERDGVVTVYGDVHNGSIIKNSEHRLIECSFGPIGRSGGRSVIPGFGPKMKDYDGRELEVSALYHKTHATPDLQKHAKGEPFYWNFLEMEFNTAQADPEIGLRIRNLIDPPGEKPRGGGSLSESASASGRPLTCKLPAIKTLPNADVRFVHTDGRPVRGIRSQADGSIPLKGLPDIAPGTQLIVTAFDGKQSASQMVVTS